MRDYLKIMGELFIFFGALALVFLALVFIYGDYTCSNYAVITGVETKHVPFDACYVKVDDRFMRWDEYKAYIVASKGLERVADL